MFATKYAALFWIVLVIALVNNCHQANDFAMGGGSHHLVSG